MFRMGHGGSPFLFFMAIIKPYKNDLWFRLPRPSNPDLDDVCFGRKGHFSPESDIAFRLHEKRITKLKNLPYYAHLNGTRIKEIRKEEKFWY